MWPCHLEVASLRLPKKGCKFECKLYNQGANLLIRLTLDIPLHKVQRGPCQLGVMNCNPKHRLGLKQELQVFLQPAGPIPPSFVCCLASLRDMATRYTALHVGVASRDSHRRLLGCHARLDILDVYRLASPRLSLCHYCALTTLHDPFSDHHHCGFLRLSSLGSGAQRESTGSHGSRQKIFIEARSLNLQVCNFRKGGASLGVKFD